MPAIAERPVSETTMPPPLLAIRTALPTDRDCIVEFNQRLARETEDKVLDPAILQRGVHHALTQPDRLRYWVAEVDARPVGQAAISREWSDWRDGWLWWLQSVYVVQDWRGRGVFRALLRHITADARAEGDVIGLRLYVESHNHDARASYQALGFQPSGHHVMEAIWSGPEVAPRPPLSPRPG